MFSYLPVKVGDTMNDAKATRRARGALRHRFLQGRAPRASRATCWWSWCDERPAIAQIDFSGIKEFEPTTTCKKALRELGLAEGAHLRPRAARSAPSRSSSASTCRAACTPRRSQTTVTPLERNRVGINIAVTEGEVAKIRGINIVGAQAFQGERAAAACSCCARPAGSPGTPSTTATRARSSPPTSRRCAPSTSTAATSTSASSRPRSRSRRTGATSTSRSTSSRARSTPCRT